ncbi:hypothetical protein [Arenimonas sp.]|uniref:hypothetical protein n=1 Tax=Arenimonas sp. TaxID=1872635 RepID=UPI0039E5F311
MPLGRFRYALFASGVALATPAPAATMIPDSPPDMNLCLQTAATRVPMPAQQALARIEGFPRKLLALRSYLRAEKDLALRWSWTDEQIRSYEASPEYAQAMEQIAQVQRRFAALNPGYALYVNREVRSLDLQLQRWNSNASVGKTADALAAAARSVCKPGSESFAAWLAAWVPSPPPNLAAPGLSPHGQARAFDFQIKRGDVLIAGTDSQRIAQDWVRTGWTKKLERAVREASPAFVGPLRTPNEPWHYSYAPERLAIPATIPR